MTNARRTTYAVATALMFLVAILSACQAKDTSKIASPNLPSDSIAKPPNYQLLATPRWIFSWWEKFKLVHIPGHLVLLGVDPEEDSKARGDETPETETRIPAFYIMDHEVTNSEYMTCVTSGACEKPANDIAGNPANDNLPVTNVNWKQAQAFCAWIDGRLPTETEWEYAAGGTSGRIFPWGNTAPSCTLANSNGCVKPGSTMPVGSLPAGFTPEGLADMAGNVREWVNDFYSPTAYQNVAMIAPSGPASGSGAVVRGGGFNDFEENLRTTARLALDPSQGYSDVGFRCIPETPSTATICPSHYSPLCPEPGQPNDPNEPCTPGLGTPGDGGIKISSFGCPVNGEVCIIFNTAGGGSAGYNALVNSNMFECGASSLGDDYIKCCGPAPTMGSTASITVCAQGQNPSENGGPTPVPVSKNLSDFILASYQQPSLLSPADAMIVTNNCSEGYQYNPDTKQCELIPTGDNCPEGWLLSAASEQCVPGSREACPEGTVYNDELKGCDPLKDECPDGYYLNNRELCEPIQNQPNICPRGYYYDKRVQCCLPLKGDNYGCTDGYYWDARYQRCLPIDQDGCPFGSLTNGYGGCDQQPEVPPENPQGGCPPGTLAAGPNTCNNEGGQEDGQGAYLRPGDQLNPVGLPEPEGGEQNQGECGSPNLTYYDPDSGACYQRDPNGCPQGYYFDVELKVCRPTNGGGSPCPPGMMFNRKLECCTPIPGNDGATCPEDENTGGSGGVGPNGYQSPALLVSSFDPQEGYCEDDTDPDPQTPGEPDCVMTYFAAVACKVCTDGSLPVCEDMTQATPTTVPGAANGAVAPAGIQQEQCPPEYWDEKSQTCNPPLPQCGEGQYYDQILGYCVALDPDCCPQGMDFSVRYKQCMPVLDKTIDGVCPDGYELKDDGLCWLLDRTTGGNTCFTMSVNVPQCQGGCEVGTVMNANGVCVKPSDPCADVTNAYCRSFKDPCPACCKFSAASGFCIKQ